VHLRSVKVFRDTTARDVLIGIAAAIVFWIVGRWLIARAFTITQAVMNRIQIDPTLTGRLGSIVRVALDIALALGVLAAPASRRGRSPCSSQARDSRPTLPGAACAKTPWPGPSCRSCVARGR